jgi:peptide/nickel transport system substrate-binding protein
MLSSIENLLYKIRDFFWKYPDLLMGRESSAFSVFAKTYLHSRPFSHVIATIFVVVLSLSFITQDVSAFLRINKDEYIEGVVTGVDENGDLFTVQKLNPLIPSSIQLERDVNEIIYEPMVKMTPDYKNEKVLAEDIKEIKPGQDYIIKLKQNVQWHDGVKFSAEDVLATHLLLQKLNNSSETQSIFSKSAKKMTVEKIDDYTLSFKVNDNGIIPNFYEVVSYKVLPAHLIKDLNETNITLPRIQINRVPVGTGPFKFTTRSNSEILLTRFNQYHKTPAKLKSIRFVAFEDETSALNALRAGQIHGLAGLTIDSAKGTTAYSYVKTYKSPTLYNQYWAIYFNIREEGPAALRDQKVRQAIAYSINKEEVLEDLDHQGEVANGPIPASSFAYNKDAVKYSFDKAKAIEILEAAGWKGEPRQKGDQVLKFTLTYVDNVDRKKIAEDIKEELGAIGVQIDLNPLPLNQVNQDYILPRRFELLLYGVNTFIDPDRYELFHSKEKNHPGLNISGYQSTKNTLDIEKGEKIEIPRSDKLLVEARGNADPEKRKPSYFEFQELVASDVPMVFLYHPTFSYLVNQRIKGIEMTNMKSVEERFNNIENWEIAV